MVFFRSALPPILSYGLRNVLAGTVKYGRLIKRVDGLSNGFEVMGDCRFILNDDLNIRKGHEFRT